MSDNGDQKGRIIFNDGRARLGLGERSRREAILASCKGSDHDQKRKITRIVRPRPSSSPGPGVGPLSGRHGVPTYRPGAVFLDR